MCSNLKTKKGVLTQDLHYDGAADIVSFMSDLFQEELTVSEISEVSRSSFKITDIMKQHLISFLPGSVQIKLNLCSCEGCLIGNFVNSVHEPGFQVGSKLINYHGGSESESESNDNFHNDNDENEEHEITGNSVFTSICMRVV